VKVYNITDRGREFLEDHISPLIIVRNVLDYLIPSITQIAGARDQQ
jgi:DNA-binding PadR family transcriptional regulator